MTQPSERGFTMVEVMIAILLTAIALIGIIALYMTETNASSFSRRTTEASVLATDKLEKMRTMSPAAGGNDVVDAQGKPTTGGTFTRRWTASGTGSWRDLAVAVGWNNDEAAVTCSTDAQCTSKFCKPTSTCASRAVIVYGRRQP